MCFVGPGSERSGLAITSPTLVDGLLGGPYCLEDGLSRKKSDGWSGFLK